MSKSLKVTKSEPGDKKDVKSSQGKSNRGKKDIDMGDYMERESMVRAWKSQYCKVIDSL